MVARAVIVASGGPMQTEIDRILAKFGFIAQ
jgi:hypothetical protein